MPIRSILNFYHVLNAIEVVYLPYHNQTILEFIFGSWNVLPSDEQGVRINRYY